MKLRTHISRSWTTAMWLVTGLSLTAADETSERQIIRGNDTFEFHYQVSLPELDGPARLWLPLATSDDYQQVELLGVTTRRPWRQVRDKDFGNAILTMAFSPQDRGATVDVRYRVTRREKSSYAADPKEPTARHLNAESLVPKNERLTRIARRVTKDATSDRDRGEALYRHTLEHMAYDKSGQGWGRGDALFACDAAAGNCTDFHAYFIGLARSIGIPARFAIGFSIPAGQDQGEIAGYHCWAEFHAEGRWIPVDISEADKHPSLKDYYFGHHPANRFQFTLGRDLEVEPAPASGPINYLVYPVLEVDDVPVPVERSFSFRRIR